MVKVSASIDFYYSYTHQNLYITGYQDDLHARKCFKDKLRDEEYAELMARLQRVPVIHAWNYTTSSISTRLSQITYSLTCWKRRCIGDYGYLEATEIIKEGKECWEALHKSPNRQAV